MWKIKISCMENYFLKNFNIGETNTGSAPENPLLSFSWKTDIIRITLPPETRDFKMKNWRVLQKSLENALLLLINSLNIPSNKLWNPYFIQLYINELCINYTALLQRRTSLYLHLNAYVFKHVANPVVFVI